MVPFDIASAQGANDNVGLVFLRAFHASLGLSSLSAFAARELDLQKVGKYEAFLERYEARQGDPWAEDRDLGSARNGFAACLAELMPDRYPSDELAHQSLGLAFENSSRAPIADIVYRFAARARQRSEVSQEARILIFVADEVGAWAGRKLKRIEEVRALVEAFVAQGEGRLWLLATSQERLSEVSPDHRTWTVPRNRGPPRPARGPLPREHPSRVERGRDVIEERVLAKRPVARPAIEGLWEAQRGTLSDIAEPPGSSSAAVIRSPNATPSSRTIRSCHTNSRRRPTSSAACEVSRSARVPGRCSRSRSTPRAAVADRPLGTVVTWDQLFDSANGGNEFADEHYLGSQGLEYLAQADRDLAGTVPIERPSRVLKVLWLIQQTGRIPSTIANLARLLVGISRPTCSPWSAMCWRRSRRSLASATFGRIQRAPMAVPHAGRGHGREDRDEDRRARCARDRGPRGSGGAGR